jgi:hypothetical protein
MEDYMTLPQRAKYRNDWEDTVMLVYCETDANRMLDAMEKAWRDAGCVGQI